MKNGILKILYMILTILCCSVMVVTVASAERISVAHEIILNGDNLSLGDVFPEVTEHAEHILAPAPTAGQTMVLTAVDLQRIANAFDLEWSPQNRFDRSIVRRNISYISKDDISKTINQALTKKMHGQKYEVELLSNNKKITLPDSEKPEIIVKNLNFNNKTRALKAEISLKTLNNETTVNLTGHAYQITKVPVLSTRLRKGDIIEEADIEIISMRLADVSPNTILDETKIIGQTPRRYIDAMHTIQPNDVRQPLAIKKGERVTLSIKNDILNISTIGKALNSGAKGEIIRVMNISSNRIIEGEITGPQQVKITGSYVSSL